MIRKLARYKVKLETTVEVESAVTEFVNAISWEEPDTVYSAFWSSEELV